MEPLIQQIGPYEMMAIALARDTVKAFISVTVFILLMRYAISGFGFPRGKIQEKLDDNPVGIAILYLGLALAIAYILGTSYQ